MKIMQWTVLVGILTVPLTICAQIPIKQEDTKQLEQDVLRFNRLLQVIRHDYVHPTSEHKLLENAMQGMASGLDPHSNFLAREDLQELQTTTTGQFSGLGIEIAGSNGVIQVVAPLEDGPAYKAGIRSGDLIVRINRSAVQGMSLREAIKKMRQSVGSIVDLSIIRKGKKTPFTVKVPCQNIHIHSVRGQELQPGFDYIRINSFQAETPSELTKLIKKFQEKSTIKGLVLDLRDNPGGLLTTAAEVANTFLDTKQIAYKKLIVYTQGHANDANIKIYAKPNALLPTTPMVVLINQGTASGAEIVAGALQDNHRAVILGTKSFGKGSVQTVIPLDESSAIKLTTALYYTPAGRSIQAKGIVPDVLVEKLKIDTTDQVGDIYLQESELNGHLDESAHTKETAKIQNNTLDLDLAHRDYQLFEALNILKGLSVLDSSNSRNG